MTLAAAVAGGGPFDRQRRRRGCRRRRERVVNGGVAAGGKACPFTVNVTVVMPSDALPALEHDPRVLRHARPV